MVNYYQILKVSPKATNAEIKSAYRRLARKIHPDVNATDTQEASKEFAKIAKAYEILSNPKQRAEYDRSLLNNQYRTSADGDSVFSSENSHAKRWRQMAYERRYNEIIDRMIADERKETMALQRAIFPTVALFISALFVGVFKPSFWTNSHLLGKIVLFSLFIAGSVHFVRRLRAAFDRYTYRGENLHDSILEENVPEIDKPYTRFTAASFLIVGTITCFGIGFVLGNFMESYLTASVPHIFISSLKPEFIFYPPIVVLLVDLMHTAASKFEH